ncbi:O-linked N-acetylglucosamine transferase family protein [Xaviernesmea oryzae]|nr:glycosyl transferase [Xaviernesmea oryzae]
MLAIIDCPFERNTFGGTYRTEYFTGHSGPASCQSVPSVLKRYQTRRVWEISQPILAKFFRRQDGTKAPSFMVNRRFTTARLFHDGFKQASSAIMGPEAGPELPAQQSLEWEDLKSLKVQRDYAAAQKSFDKREYHDVLAILNRLLDIDKDPRHYALLGATLVKLRMKEEAAQAFQVAGSTESRHQLKYLREAMRIHFSNGDDISTLRIGARILNEALADPDMAALMTGALMRQDMEGIGAFRKTLGESAVEAHRHLAVRSIKLAERSEEEHKLIEDVFERFPDDKFVRNFYLSIARDTNNYEIVDKYQPIVDAEIARGDLEAIRSEVSLYNMRWCGDEKVNAIAGADTGQKKPAGVTAKRHAMPHKWGDKLRIGYLSADLWTDHAVMKALRGVLEAHDRTRFDITLFCNTDPENLRTRNSANREEWGKIVSVRGKTDEEAVDAIKAANIDILVDLQGHTADNRVFLLNHMTAPIHVTWLGYPGTVVNVDIDYLICDRTVVPESSIPNYYEKLCWMPETFFPNSVAHRPLPGSVERQVCGMPDGAFIFSCFHSQWKYTRTTVDLWARILKEAPDAYLYLICRERFGARANLRKAFADAGISSDRILFGDRLVDYTSYLTRISLTDLGLDTYPYNGHTTTSEKLWSGLPMLTYKGTNFASRVSESLLNALGLPEMVADDPDDYVRRAVHFYNNREELAQIRKRLHANRFTHPLFDADRFCRHLEKAYEMMADRAKAGQKPDHFEVPALPARSEPFISRAA